MASFLLHQATENYLHTITLVFTLYQYKLHKLAKLMKHCKKHTLEIGKIFPQDTEEEKRLFNLLEDAYVQSRHNMYFRVSQEDIEALTPKVEQLRNLTKRISRERLDYYEKMKGN